MKWFDISNPPTNSLEVLVTDGDGSYAVAWYNIKSKKWNASEELIVAQEYDGSFCKIELLDFTKWCLIEGL